LRLLDEQSIEDIATGAAILGSGGGGDPYIGKLMAIDAIRENGPVKLLDPTELDDEGLVVPVAIMGAPTVIVEKIPRGDEVLEAFHALEKRLGRRAVATTSAEAGGLNSTIPLAVAARLRIPAVDCDGMGRAFPEIPMVTFTLHGVSATPMTMSDEKGNFVLLETIDNHWTEWIARSIATVMGGSALIALYPMTGRQVKAASVLHSLSLEEQIGKTLREAHARKQDPLERLLKLLNGFLLFEGKVVDIFRRTEGGWAKGEARFEGLGRFRGQNLVLRFQNENLVVLRDGEVLATVPDLITTVESETAMPITTEGLRYGLRAKVLGFPCNKQWRTEGGVHLAGPRHFGYDLDYVPIENRFSKKG